MCRYFSLVSQGLGGVLVGKRFGIDTVCLFSDFRRISQALEQAVRLIGVDENSGLQVTATHSGELCDELASFHS